MTAYEYRCKECDAVFDRMFEFGKADSEVECECGGTARRVFGNAGIIFKGPGDHWPSQQLRRKRQMTRNNEEAGRRMRKTWDGAMPKLVDQ
jgi:putative FmdB family regulatory protein